MTPVFGMPWNRWMTADMLWAEPDVFDGATKMRHVFNNQDEAKGKGKLLQDDIYNNFTDEVVGKKLIEEIERML
jgi:hypothetical protein